MLRRSLLVLCSVAACSGDGGGDGTIRTGFVSAFQQLIISGGKPITFAGVRAQFFEGTDPWLCQTHMAGGCTMTDCAHRETGDQIIVPPPRPDAGRVTVTLGARVIVIEPDATKFYPSQEQHEPLWVSGDSITVTVAGALVPAFSGRLVGPGDVAVTEPPTNLNAPPLVVRRNAGLAVAWAGGGTGEVTFSLVPEASVPETRGRLVGLGCRFPAAAGHGTIPAGMLTRMPRGPVLITAGTEAVQDLSRDGWQLTFLLGGAATAVGGQMPYLVSSMFE